MSEPIYQKIEKIGEGTYGVVYKAREKGSGRLVALKKIRLADEKEGIPATTIREISLLKSLRHSTIVNLEAVIYKDNKMYLVMEYLDLDLRNYLDGLRKAGKKIPEEALKRFVHQIVTAIDFCHSRAVLHRDIKPQNILIGADHNLKLADFGLGRSISIPLRTYTHDVVTLWYRAPELLLGDKHYSEGIDMWSVGAIIAEMVMLVPLFQGDSEIDQVLKVFKVLGTPTEETWHGVTDLPSFNTKMPAYEKKDLKDILNCDIMLLDLIKRMLVYNPQKRISARKALRHPFLRNLPPIYE